MAKIIIVDNYGRDNISDRLHSEGHTEDEAIALATDFNARAGELSSSYYVVKPDDYKLYVWEP